MRPFLDFDAPGFSTRSQQVSDARVQHWCAVTPYGLAVLRHREAGLLLRDRRLRQGSWSWPRAHGMTGPFAQFWERSLIAMTGEAHRAARQVALAALKDEHIQSLAPRFEAIAAALPVPGDGRIEFMGGWAKPFAGRAVAALLDTEDTGFAEDASTLGLAMGVRCREHEREVDAAYLRLAARAQEQLEGTQGGYVGRLRRHAGTLSATALNDLVVISIFGGVDTTRSQISHALWLFSQHPGQWFALRENPSLAPAAVEEAIRTFPTTTWATREAIESFEFGGERIEAGSTIHVLVHASARDPAIDDGGGFDIRARRKVHFGFGGGAHHCIGAAVARADLAAALRVLAARYCRVEAEPGAEWLPDSGNTSPVTLPLRLVA